MVESRLAVKRKRLSGEMATALIPPQCIKPSVLQSWQVTRRSFRVLVELLDEDNKLPPDCCIVMGWRGTGRGRGRSCPWSARSNPGG